MTKLVIASMIFAGSILLTSCSVDAYNKAFEDCMQKYLSSNPVYDNFTMSEMVDMCKTYAKNKSYM